jgi:hypothetical protein
MTAILSLLLVVVLSILITRVAAIALTHTGMAQQAARFQARSAFSGAGFTTTESEQVVNHPVRRRIVLMLMLLGNAGIVTAVSSLILAFARRGQEGWPLEVKIPLLVLGIVALWALASSNLFDRFLSRIVERLLNRYTDLEIRDYAGLLRLGGNYRIAEILVAPDSWLAGRSLAEARPAAEGILVLGIDRSSGLWFGTPDGDTELDAGDTLVVYGRTEAIEALQQRRRGQEAVQEQEEAIATQDQVSARERMEQRESSPENS